MNSSAHSLVPLLYSCVHIFLFIEKCIWNLHCDFLSEAVSLKSVWWSSGFPIKNPMNMSYLVLGCLE
jgi:hypothetical protein